MNKMQGRYSKVGSLLLLIFLLTGCSESENDRELVDFPYPWEEGEEILLPEGYVILDSCSGDLDLDGEEDYAVIIQKMEDGVGTERTIYLLKKYKNGKWKILDSNLGLIGDSLSGGPFGDSYSGMKMEDGNFRVELYGGSSLRWGESYQFCYDKKQKEMLLNQVEITAFNAFNSNGTDTIVDLENGCYEARTFSSEEGFDKLLLRKGEIDRKETETEFSGFLGIEALKLPESYYPSLDQFQFGEYTSAEQFQISATEALDLVKEKYQPDFEAKQMNSGSEILLNYQKIFRYPVPDYYYTDGSSILYYYGSSETEQGVLHRIAAAPSFDFYEVWDKDGKVITDLEQ